jgi:type I restriction enzyme S subunit
VSRHPRLGDYFENRQESGREGLPTLSVTMNDGIIHRDDLERRTETTLRPDQHLLVRRGDIAYNMMRMWQGACGLAAIDGLVSPAYIVLAPKKNIDTRFAYHWFKSDRMIYLFWAYSHGLTEDRLRLYFDDFAEIPIAPPDLKQQQRIAMVLDAWDGAIAQCERLIAATRQSYYSKLNEFTNAATWPLRRLDEIARLNVRSLPAKTNPDFEFDYFDIAAADDGTNEELSGRISFKSAPSRARRQVLNEGVVYSTVRPLLRRLFIAKSRPDAVYSTGYSIIEPLKNCSIVFLKHMLVSNHIEKQVYARLTGTGYPAINENDLKEIKFPLPDLACQTLIGGELTEIEKTISLYSMYSNLLRKQRRGLMQKVLAGGMELGARFDAGIFRESALAGEIR